MAYEDHFTAFYQFVFGSSFRERREPRGGSKQESKGKERKDKVRKGQVKKVGSSNFNMKTCR